MNQDFSQYKLVVAPMLYMLKPDVAENIRTYVENGGTVVFTYCTGNVVSQISALRVDFQEMD